MPNNTSVKMTQCIYREHVEGLNIKLGPSFFCSKTHISKDIEQVYSCCGVSLASIQWGLPIALMAANCAWLLLWQLSFVCVGRNLSLSIKERWLSQITHFCVLVGLLGVIVFLVFRLFVCVCELVWVMSGLLVLCLFVMVICLSLWWL